MTTGVCGGTMVPALYVFAGAPKCGSTWLHENLCRHPGVTAAKIKDPYYFDRFHDRGDDWYWSLFGLDGASEPRGVYADVSHDYLYHEKFPQRCLATATARGMQPFVHLVLRNPVDRMLSAVRYQISFDGSRRPGAVEQAYPRFLSESLYAAHVRRILQAFPENRGRIDLFDDLVDDPAGFMRAVYSWLSLPHHEVEIDGAPRRNERAPRHPRTALALRNAGQLARRLGLLRTVQAAKRSATIERVLFRRSAHDDPLADIDRARLWERVAPDVAELSQLLGRDVSSRWGPNP